MRAVVQRVSKAEVIVENNVVGSIKNGILVFLGIEDSDNQDDVVYMVEKTVNLRIFEDEEGKMNKSIVDIYGQMLVISQFTLHGDCRKGRRPSFIHAARPEKASELYESFIAKSREMDIKTESGIFQADMKVSLINDGPVTLLIDSKKTF